MAIQVERNCCRPFKKKIQSKPSSLYFYVTKNFSYLHYLYSGYFPWSDYFYPVKYLIACFLSNNLPHSFLIKLFHIHCVLHWAVHKCSLYSTATMEFLGGFHEETVYAWCFPALNDRAIKAIVSSSKLCFSYALRLSLLQHYSFQRKNKYYRVSLTWKQNHTTEESGHY